MSGSIPAPTVTIDRFGRRDVVLTPETSGKALELIDGMRCNHVPGLLELGPCKTPPAWSPRLVVPSRTQMAEGHRHLHLDLVQLHYCEAHKGELKVDEILAAHGVKRTLEEHAKKTRPLDFKCDFEFAAHLVYVNIFTPEYKLFAVIQAMRSRQGAYDTWGAPLVAL